MSRYFTQRPRANFVGDVEQIGLPLLLDLTVSDHEPVDTGLVDQRGDPIMRGPETIGFHHPRES